MTCSFKFITRHIYAFQDVICDYKCFNCGTEFSVSEKYNPKDYQDTWEKY
jgi:hypothetical protein